MLTRVQQKRLQLVMLSAWERRRVLCLLLTLLIGLVVWLNLGDVTGRHYSQDELQAKFDAYSPRIADSIEEVACEGVNQLEGRVDEALRQSSSVAGQAFQEYAAQLHRFRKAISKSYGGEQARCRTDHLGRTLYAEGRDLRQKWDNMRSENTEQTWGQYRSLMMELTVPLSKLDQCQRFWTSGTFIWQWCSSGDFRIIDQDPDAAGKLAPAIEAGTDYGHPVIGKSHLRGHGSVKMERVQHAQHLLVLQRSATTDVQTDLDQIVEFGGGTGDMAALVRDIGFNGMYVIYDMEPMTLLQLYWLRYSGHAALLSKNVQNVPEVKQHALIVQAAEDTVGFRKILSQEPHVALRSVFLSFWAFNEADVDARDRIRPDIQNFGRIVLAVYFNAEGRYGWGEESHKNGVEVVSYMKTWVEHLLATHNTCMWHFKTWDTSFPAGGYYFVATRKELPPPLCLASLNCDSTTKHPSIPSTC